MTNRILIIPIGTQIYTKIGNISAMITSVTIRENSVMYNCCYANGGDIKVAELYEFEFENAPTKKTEIGFK